MKKNSMVFFLFLSFSSFGYADDGSYCKNILLKSPANTLMTRGTIQSIYDCTLTMSKSLEESPYGAVGAPDKLCAVEGIFENRTHIAVQRIHSWVQNPPAFFVMANTGNAFYSPYYTLPKNSNKYYQDGSTRLFEINARKKHMSSASVQFSSDARQHVSANYYESGKKLNGHVGEIANDEYFCIKE